MIVWVRAYTRIEIDNNQTGMRNNIHDKRYQIQVYFHGVS